MNGWKTLLVVVAVAVLAIGCGDPAECDCPGLEHDCLDGFFETYYPECIAWLDEYNEWLISCDAREIADHGECVRNMWLLGHTNEFCNGMRASTARKSSLPDGDQPDQRCGYASEYDGPGCPPGAQYEPTY